ncbi:sulfotransferase [Candidatus Kaiserbacteria bacterium]|nr:sulfotransferase [Candidatus Kaiserbacteria bacterium]
MVDFIGLGAQKAGTSWVYACLYEHPEICTPQKEIHFFSRDRYAKGKNWYESQFNRCKKGLKRGEFSTSYLYTPGTAKKIVDMYPQAKLIAIIRNPIHRAYSQFRNAVKAGEIDKDTTFSSYIEHAPSALEQGNYAKQLSEYYEYYSPLQLLVLVYEDSREDPLGFIQQIYRHIGVDDTFVPKMLKKFVNVERTPRFVRLERWMHRFAELGRKIGLDKVVWMIKRSGVTDLIRKINTEKNSQVIPEDSKGKPIDPEVKAKMQEYFKEDTRLLSGLVERNLTVEWGIDEKL